VNRLLWRLRQRLVEPFRSRMTDARCDKLFEAVKDRPRNIRFAAYAMMPTEYKLKGLERCFAPKGDD